MKKSLVFTVILCMLYLTPARAQVGKFLKNVKNSVKQELLVTPDNNSAKARPEPACACDPAELIMEMGKYQLDYTELSISVLDDGSILVKENASDNYYIAKSGVTEGPYKTGDPKIAQFRVTGENTSAVDEKDISTIFKDYIRKSGDKYLITFDGKNYGPYSLVSRFIVSVAKDKFVATVTENVAFTEDQGKKMEAAMNNAKTDEERAQLAVQYGQQMQQNIMNGGSQSLMPKFISNIPGAKIDDMATLIGAQFYNNMKYDDIVMVSMNKVMDLQGNTIMTYSNANCDPETMFVSSDNSRYACYKYGTLTFNDNKTLSELFNPHLIKTEGKIFLAYMYYSPKKNAIMQCKIPF